MNGGVCMQHADIAQFVTGFGFVDVGLKILENCSIPCW